MRKIPTLFRRDPSDMARVLPEVHPHCRWVLDGEGVATRKYDGTCMMLDEYDIWWARREVKPGKQPPEGFQAVETDPETGKTVGWEPAHQSPFAKAWNEAAQSWKRGVWPAGTYELVGPKVQGNPENYDQHTLLPHAEADEVDEPPREFDALLRWLLSQKGIIEGVVWHHPDGRMAKLKVRDADVTVRLNR